jgi:hypothetical protein
VKEPGLFDSLFGETSWGGLIRDWFNNYYGMINACRYVRESKYKSKIHWPDNSLIGAYTWDAYNFEYEDKWLKIVASVIQ